jgi:hypothetical protein
MKHVLVLFLTCSALVLCGCPPPAPKAVGIYGAQVRNLGAPGLTMNMTLLVRNDNSFDIQIRNVRVSSIVLANRYPLPPMVSSPNTWLPAGRTTQVAVPVTIPWNMVPQLMATTVGSRYVTFYVNGYADVTATRALEVDLNDYAFNDQGAVPREEIAIAAARGNLPIPSFQYAP